MKWVIFFLILFLITLVSATEDANYVSYRVDEPAVLKIRVSNQTDVVSDAICVLDIYNTSDDIVVNNDLMSFSARRYNYSFIFNSTGEWFVEYFCNNSGHTETVVYGREISVQENDMDTVGDNLSMILDDTQVIQNNQVIINNNIVEVNDTVSTINLTLNDVNITVNNISSIVWDTNTSEHNITGTFGNIMDFISTTVFWIERLI